MGGDNYTSPIVAIRKPDWDLKTCEDYKIVVNHQIYSYSFLLPNIESASHKLTSMKYFVKNRSQISKLN